MRFISPRDYASIVKINQELINEVLDTTVIIYKLNSAVAETNSYNEAKSKTWYVPTQVPCRIERSNPTVVSQLQTVDISQDCKFSFLRAELEDRNIYPEMGDYVSFDNLYYEIHNTDETQLWGGRVEYKHSVVCEAHLTRKTQLQLEPPQL